MQPQQATCNVESDQSVDDSAYIYNHGIIIWCRPKNEREGGGGEGEGGGGGGGEVVVSIVV